MGVKWSIKHVITKLSIQPKKELFKLKQMSAHRARPAMVRLAGDATSFFSKTYLSYPRSANSPSCKIKRERERERTHLQHVHSASSTVHLVNEPFSKRCCILYRRFLSFYIMHNECFTKTGYSHLQEILFIMCFCSFCQPCNLHCVLMAKFL